MKTPLLVIHIAAGCIGIMTGYTALAVGKGSVLHRKSGMRFLFAMLVMGSTAGGLDGAGAPHMTPFVRDQHPVSRPNARIRVRRDTDEPCTGDQTRRSLERGGSVGSLANSTK